MFLIQLNWSLNLPASRHWIPHNHFGNYTSQNVWYIHYPGCQGSLSQKSFDADLFMLRSWKCEHVSNDEGQVQECWYIYIYMCVCVWVYIYIYIYVGFDPSWKHLTGLAKPKSCDTTKQSVCGWQYIYSPCGLSSLVGKFAGYHIYWNVIALLKNRALQVADTVYIKRYT